MLLHGWPQHHYAYRDLLADPPPGLRIIAPDLPGYGWSGPAPHKWAKEDVAGDVLALLDELGLGTVLLVGHDWGGWIGYLLILGAPERFSGYLALNIPHPWNPPQTMRRRLWRSLTYQPAMAAFGVPLQRHTKMIERLVFGAEARLGATFDPADVRIFAERFRDPVCARAGRDTYRTLWLRELRTALRIGDGRHATVPIRALFGVRDFGIPVSLASPDNVRADDYTLQEADCGHFIADEKPDLVRAGLVQLAQDTEPVKN